MSGEHGDGRRRRSRRRVLAALAVGGLAGCLRLESQDDTATSTTAATSTVRATADADTETESTETSGSTTVSAPPETDWPQFQADAGNRGYVQDAVGPTESPDLAWQVNAGGDGAAVMDGVAYTGFDLTAVDAASGESLFETYTGRTTPAVGDGVAFVGNDDALVAVETDGGDTAWEVAVEGTVTAPTLADGSVYVGAVDEYEDGFTVGVHAFDADDGSRRWLTETDVGVERPVACDGDRVLAALGGRTLVALDAGDGRERWRVDGVSRFSAPTLVDDTVYIVGDGDRENALLALDATDGSVQWSFALGGDGHVSPAVTEDRVYVGTTEDQAMYAVDRADGTRWWRASIDGWALGSPAVTADTVYVGTRNGTVHALAVGDAAERFVVDLGSETVASPAVASGRLLVSTDRVTYAFE
ncbi:PQQ-binding-like beta-propeller repeat protein [Halorubellus sp. PRR65]|uniref:outer membrane protein assembly factor BamB family protein n=1 Tax=Halorubellus sp. PRR65 TaxID=3098148 RepID=UPI002B261B38|nr:PQQ-binding-like beta-propeller repeat protein [Halorubellus sp. PRR65]